MLKRKSSINDKQKLPKMKKNALDPVDIEEEKKRDPKYKTELCKSFIENLFCPYGNRCRFAHGKQELFSKPVDPSKYKQKECNSFKENGYCAYGARCSFKHDERTLENVQRSFYFWQLHMNYYPPSEYCLNIHQNKNRLEVFQTVTPTQAAGDDNGIICQDEISRDYWMINHTFDMNKTSKTSPRSLKEKIILFTWNKSMQVIPRFR